MTSLTPSPLMVSLLLTAESLPFLALGLPAGALADIVDRRRLLIVTQVAMAVAMGTLAFVTLSGVATPWMLLAFAFALGIATALNDPAWHAVVPELLPKEDAVGFGLLLGSLGVGAVGGAAFLPRLRSRIAAEVLVATGCLTLAAVAIGAATLRELFLLGPIMLVGGVAWISVLSTLTVAAQQASPPWVRARALAVYLIVLQAGIAGGSVLWGAVASRAGLSAAYFGIAGGLLLGAALAVRVRAGADEVVDHTPAHHWADPVVTGELSLEAGPIMVQAEYSVDPPRAEAFRSTMAELGRNRRRDGAVQWWLFQDTADPSRFVETWIEATWAEHLRNHERASVAHKEIEERVRDLTRSGSTITTRHFIAPETRPSTDAVVRAVEERTRC